MRRRTYLCSLAAVGLASGCLGIGPGAGPSSNPGPGPADASPTRTGTGTPTATPTASLGSIDEPTLEAAVLEAVFEARGSTLTHQGTLYEKLDEMASYHSDRMARERTVAHVIDGETTEDRFHEFDIDCRFKGRGDEYLVPLDHQELVASVSTRGVTVEEAARTLVQGWLDDPDAGERLQYENAEYVAVGATIVTGRAYVTVLYC